MNRFPADMIDLALLLAIQMKYIHRAFYSLLVIIAHRHIALNYDTQCEHGSNAADGERRSACAGSDVRG